MNTSLCRFRGEAIASTSRLSRANTPDILLGSKRDAHFARRRSLHRHTHRQYATLSTSPHTIPESFNTTFRQALSNTQPCFGARGDEISLLTSPTDFREKLLEMIRRAKKRILISSLYIGAEQQELVETSFLTEDRSTLYVQYYMRSPAYE
jgi:phosphatidylserine/phosphatidylglycerophosphate/cardiolipin synthase-like enzyme